MLYNDVELSFYSNTEQVSFFATFSDLLFHFYDAPWAGARSRQTSRHFLKSKWGYRLPLSFALFKLKEGEYEYKTLECQLL